MDDGTTAPSLLPLGTTRGALRLRSLRRLDGLAEILLHCRGIEVGRLALSGPVEADATIEVPVARLPRVSLPAELRVSAAIAGPDLAPPWPIESPAAALDLLGPPAPVVEELRLEAGVLRGVAVERTNGLLEPVLYARINDAGARAVAVETPAPLAEGGCAFRFGLALQPADLTESGLAVTLHLVGLETPLARTAWARTGLGEPEARIVELEGRLRRLEQSAATGLLAAQEEMRRRLDIQQERIDAFIEAAASLLLDRIAGAPEELRGLIAAAASEPPAEAPVLLRLDRQVELPTEAGHFGFGWHTPERDADGPFRWMADRALVVNPEPDRKVAAVTLAISHVYGAPEPALRAGFDDLPCAVEVAPAGAHRFTLRITPPDGIAATCRSLRLEALSSGVPARDGVSADDRLLSMAVARLVFDFSDGAGP
jgi:hypothetical protein